MPPNDDQEAPKVDSPPVRKQWKRYSYRNYLPKSVTKYTDPPTPSPAHFTSFSSSNSQVKKFYLISTAFKLAKIVAAVVIALVFIGLV